MQLTHFAAGNHLPLFLIAGPCVVETESLAVDTAGALKSMTDDLGIPFIFKSSFDKANRSSLESYRGPGIDEGVRILDRVKPAEHGLIVRTAAEHATEADLEADLTVEGEEIEGEVPAEGEEAPDEDAPAEEEKTEEGASE